MNKNGIGITLILIILYIIILLLYHLLWSFIVLSIIDCLVNNDVICVFNRFVWSFGAFFSSLTCIQHSLHSFYIMVCLYFTYLTMHSGYYYRYVYAPCMWIHSRSIAYCFSYLNPWLLIWLLHTRILNRGFSNDQLKVGVIWNVKCQWGT